MWQSKRALNQLKNEGRTRSWVARYCGVSQQSIDSFLTGRKAPRLPLVKLMAQALNTTEGYLMGQDLIQNQNQEVLRTG